jgi:hypothetical protein
MALSNPQRNTVRTALTNLAAQADSGYTKGGAITTTEFALRVLSDLDSMRTQTRSREWYTVRYEPWLRLNLPSLSNAVRTAIANHVNGA